MLHFWIFRFPTRKISKNIGYHQPIFSCIRENLDQRNALFSHIFCIAKKKHDSSFWLTFFMETENNLINLTSWINWLDFVDYWNSSFSFLPSYICLCFFLVFLMHQLCFSFLRGKGFLLFLLPLIFVDDVAAVTVVCLLVFTL